MGSGGRNASLAAILEGQGGQQKRQHISLKLSPIPFIMLYWSLRKILSSETLRAHWFDREFYSETKYSCLNLRMHFIFKSHNQCSKVVQVWVWSGAVNESRSGSASSSGHDTQHGTDRPEIAFASDVTEMVTNQEWSSWLSQWETRAWDVYLCIHIIQQQHGVEQERIR